MKDSDKLDTECEALLAENDFRANFCARNEIWFLLLIGILLSSQQGNTSRGGAVGSSLGS
jgi:hypothetical protein